MRRALGLTIAALLVLAGVVWSLQGLGYLTGSAMSGQSVWAVIGPITAGFGLALGIVVLQRRS